MSSNQESLEIVTINKDNNDNSNKNDNNINNNNSTTTSSSLTPEQEKRIEENRLKALSKLRERQQTNGVTTNNTNTNNDNDNKNNEPKKLVPIKKFQNYVEYDFSKMVDTRGGFLVEEEDSEEKNPKKKRKIKTSEPELDPYSMYGPNPDEIPHCKECDSIEIDLDFNKVFSVNVCKPCKDRFPEKYSLITKTEAKEDYLLVDAELKDPDNFKYIEKPNPHKSSWNNMMLFLREQVEEYAFKKWGGAEGLDKEFEKRQEEKKKKKDQKFKSKLADLRKRTRTDSFKINQKPHKHEFGQAITDSKTGKSTQCCSVCGLVIEVDLF